MNETGSSEEVVNKAEKENEAVLDGSDWQKIAFQVRGQVVRQLNEVAHYCREQRKSKRPANSLKNAWARTEISALSAIISALKDAELEILKTRIGVIENVSRSST